MLLRKNLSLLVLTCSLFALPNCGKSVLTKIKSQDGSNSPSSNTKSPAPTNIEDVKSSASPLNGQWSSDSWDINDMTFTRVVVNESSIRIQECETDDYCPVEYVGDIKTVTKSFSVGYSLYGDYQDVVISAYGTDFNSAGYSKLLYIGLTKQNGKDVLLFSETQSDTSNNAMKVLIKD